MVTKKNKRTFAAILCIFIIQLFTINCYSYADAVPLSPLVQSEALSGGAGVGTGTVTPDLFTGTINHRIPIQVPVGRKGIEPSLALTYRSNNGNEWIGVGWDLDVGDIERNTFSGVQYSGDDVIFRSSGSTMNLTLVDPANNIYQAKIEGAFIRFKAIKDTNGNIISWIATSRTGTQFFYGSSAVSRQDNPDNATQIFKWCLDKIQDTNGNYINFYYIKDQGQIYPDHIDYTGNGALNPTNTVKFYREPRTDAPAMNTTNFRVKTAYRLKTIEVLANGNPVRAYMLTYAYSASTLRSVLTSVQQYDKDVTIDATSGKVTSGSALPAITFGWQDSSAQSGTFPTSYNWTSTIGQFGELQSGDFNGDGKSDLYMFDYIAGNHTVFINNGDGTFPTTPTWRSGPGYGVASVPLTTNRYYPQLGDFNGDGKTDIYLFNSTTGNHIVWLNNGDGTFTKNSSTWWESGAGYGVGYVVQLGDFNKDGKLDIYMNNPNTGDHIVWCNSGDGTFPTGTNPYKWKSGGGYGTGYTVGLGDFNGDGKTDIYIFNTYPVGNHIVWLNNGDGTFTKTSSTWWESGGGHWVGGLVLVMDWVAKLYTNDTKIALGDFNGDGKTDILMYFNDLAGSGWYAVWLNNGNGTFPPNYTWQIGPDYRLASNVFIGDFNGDWKSDIYMYNYLTGDNIVWLGNGDGTFPANYKWQSGGEIKDYPQLGDFNGDGKTDIYLLNYTAGTHHVWLNQGPYPDLLSTISNGGGGTTTISYTPSTQYTNTQLPFPVQTVSSISTNDGNGVISTTNYTYSGGYYHIGERDFRGFNYVKVTGPVGPNGEQSVAETWYHQGNDTAVGANDDPTGAVGYMKGKPYHTRVSDANGNVYAETTISYAPQPSGATPPPYFNPPYQVDVYNCDGTVQIPGTCIGNSSAQHIQTVYTTYDQYGNVTSQYLSGDMNNSTDSSARTVVRNYLPNTTAWILNLPTNQTVYSAVTGSQVASTDYYYDYSTSHTQPTKGNLTQIVRWLDGTHDPIAQMTYDGYGNLTSTTDPNGNPPATIAYDNSTHTFPTVVKNSLGQLATTQYYGVDGILTDNGLYGQVKSVTDPNGAATTMTYDTFGRKKNVTAPDGGWTKWTYPITPGTGTSTNIFGAVGMQNIQVDTAVDTVTVLSAWTYFDGLGRSIIGKQTGPGGKVIANKTSYNKTGTVSQTTLPYFNGTETPRWTGFKYDPMGRIIHLDNPDGTSADSCYYSGVTVVIDADKHRKRETKNVHGKIVKVEEYYGTYSSCTTDAGSPYATTTYAYDVFGNLQYVADAEGNETVMEYDGLNRKTYMWDPDMGNFSYYYDANGNLLEVDATGLGGSTAKATTYTYDALNRLIETDYSKGAITDWANYGMAAYYSYDETWSTNSVGKLTTMYDDSGTTKYYYDNRGRATKVTKTVGGKTYTTEGKYDLGGRIASIKYPGTDAETVAYTYDAGDLSKVTGTTTTTTTNYATYTNYNALGQPGGVTYGNNVSTTYQYYDTANSRLKNIITTKPGAPQPYLSLTYDYNNGGNVKSVVDGIDPTRTQTFIYDDINRLQQAQSTNYGGNGVLSYFYDQIGNFLSKENISYSYDWYPAHAVSSTSDGKTYIYDDYGNMTADGMRTIAYNYENKPKSVTINGKTTSFVYDGNGARVKKVSPSGTTLYIGELYECKGVACSKHIFAGGTRVALKSGTTTYYYHQDHLGSSSLITDNNGNKVEEIHYLPFGAVITDSGTVSTNYKYTSQEFDAETGLYYYNARYYNPALARFITADTIVPAPFNPQTLNRYSYVINNPLRYSDPSGHGLFSWSNRVTNKLMGWYATRGFAITPALVKSIYITEAAFLIGDLLGVFDIPAMYAEAGVEVDASIAAFSAGDGGWITVSVTVPGTGITIAVPSEVVYGTTIAAETYISMDAYGAFSGNISSGGGNLGGGGINNPYKDALLRDTRAFFRESLPYEVRGLQRFCSCLADELNPAVPGMLDAVGPGLEQYFTYRAWNHAATSASKTFGTSYLLYPAKSSIYRGFITRAGRAGAIGFLLSLDVTLGTCVVDEWNYFFP